MQIWPNIRSRVPSKAIRVFFGVNKLDPFNIREIFATHTINRTINDKGEHTTRPGYSVLGTFGTRVLGLGVWRETELHAVFNDGTWRRWNGTSWDTLASGLNTTAEWTFTNFAGNLGGVCLIGTNGVDSARYYNGISVQVLSGVPAGANYITQYADRLWAAVGNELHASAYRMATDWTTVNGDDADSWYAVIETPDGETINGIGHDMSKLIITKPSSMHKLMGYAPSDYTIQPVTFDTGQINNKCGVTVDGWLYQLFDNGLYRYAGGSAPERDFSARVWEFFGRIQSAGKALSSLGTDGTKVYSSLAVNGPVPDTLIVYDTKKDTFFVWEGISAIHFAQIGTTLYIGDASGRVLRLGGTTDNGAAITWSWVSIPFVAESMAQTIRFKRMWLTVDLPTGSSMNVSLSKYVDSDTWESVGSLTAQSDIQRKAIYVASNKVSLAKQLRYKIEGSGPCTIHEIAWEQDTYPVR